MYTAGQISDNQDLSRPSQGHLRRNVINGTAKMVWSPALMFNVGTQHCHARISERRRFVKFRSDTMVVQNGPDL